MAEQRLVPVEQALGSEEVGRFHKRVGRPREKPLQEKSSRMSRSTHLRETLQRPHLSQETPFLGKPRGGAPIPRSTRGTMTAEVMTTTPDSAAIEPQITPETPTQRVKAIESTRFDAIIRSASTICERITPAPFRNTERIVPVFRTMIQIAAAITSRKGGLNPAHAWMNGGATRIRSAAPEMLNKSPMRKARRRALRTHSASPRPIASPYAGQSGASTKPARATTTRKTRMVTEYA